MRAQDQDGPPAGWVANGNVLVPSPLVAAYAARRQVVKGVCRSKPCNRRIELDPLTMCGEGLGRLTMEQVQQLWRCNRLGGCAMEFRAERPEAPLVLGQFIGKPNVRLRLKCRGDRCKFFRVWRVEEMIAGLQKRGQGGNSTPVSELGAMMTTPCPLCKKANWTADVLWIETDTMGWRASGEGSFDRIAEGG